MDQAIKLTVRLPSDLHDALKWRAATGTRSLNQVIVDLLYREMIGQEVCEDSEYEKALRESGLWQPLGPEWDDLIAEGEEHTLEEIRAILSKGEGPTLSELIIAERDSRE